MTSRISAEFRRDFSRLPERVQEQARSAYKLFAVNPHHPGLKFKKLPPFEDIWSVRINNDYRAIGRVQQDVIVWFFVGSHADYDKLLDRM